jgi:pyruvate dehydrogenase E2 component (dihydrolipoamide acetyltransferase)
MAEAVFMPRLGQSVESCIITEWLKKKGDSIKEGDVLFCYETDKASFEETARVSGILLDIFYKEGDEVPVLANVAVIGKSGEETSSFRSTPSSASINEPTNILPENSKSELSNNVGVFDANTSSVLAGKTKVSPRAKNIAESKGISLVGIKGSGPNGRIIVRDIEEAETSNHKADIIVSAVSNMPIASGSDFTEIPLSNIRKLIAKSMYASLQNSAQLTHHTTADARKILALRASYKIKYEKGEIPNISLNDMVCYATIRAIEKMPAINSHFLGDRIKNFRKVHLGIAVDTERGLMVPVIRNADDLKLKALAAQIRFVAESCRKGNIDPDLLKSENASFTISNLGSYGVEMFTPVINLPQTGILGVGTITYRAADLGNGTIGFIPVIGLSLTYDHRSLDGAPASAFLSEISNQINNFSNELI